MAMPTLGTSTPRDTTSSAEVRTGPFGRLARLILAAFVTLSLVSIVDQGGLGAFRDLDILAEPSLWLLGAVTVTLFVHLVGEIARAWQGNAVVRRYRYAALASVVAAVALAAGIGLVASGAAWGFPLADLVWWFVVLMLIQTIAALLVAIVIGTPGCEIGVWSELLWGARGSRRTDLPWVVCVVGLHWLDRWEATRR